MIVSGQTLPGPCVRATCTELPFFIQSYQQSHLGILSVMQGSD
jgi:hypothetical protein